MFLLNLRLCILSVLPNRHQLPFILVPTKIKLSRWSVVYHPEVERTLELHLVHAFTYDSPVHCVKISPDGKTYINELKTGSNIWLVPEPTVFKIWIDGIDFSAFVDRYVKDWINISSVQFSPDGRFLATRASDRQVRVRSL